MVVDIVTGPFGPAVIAAAAFSLLAIARLIAEAAFKWICPPQGDIGMVVVAIIAVACLLGGFIALANSSANSGMQACPTVYPAAHSSSC